MNSAIKIDIEDAAGGVLTGRIWLFDVGSIMYETSSSYKTHNVIVENGGVILGVDNSYYLFNEPKIYNTDDIFVMRIVQFISDYGTTAGGEGNYRFSLDLNNSYVQENRVNIPECFKMQIHGNYANAWINYFKSNQGFEQFEDELGILYIYDNRVFTLTHSICIVDMEVQG